LNATSFAAESVCCWNFSTQIGVTAAMTAVSARWVAIFSAVLPSVHPSDENPTIVNATAPSTAPHTAGFTPGWIFISSPWLWEKGTSPVSDQRGNIARGETAKTGSETTQTTPFPLDCRISRTGPNSLADLTLQISSLNVSTARCLMIMTPRSRLACKSALYVPTSVAAEKQHRARKLLSRPFFHRYTRRFNRAFTPLHEPAASLAAA